MVNMSSDWFKMHLCHAFSRLPVSPMNDILRLVHAMQQMTLAEVQSMLWFVS